MATGEKSLPEEGGGAVPQRSATAGELSYGGEALGVVKGRRASVFCAEAECSAWRSNGVVRRKMVNVGVGKS